MHVYIDGWPRWSPPTPRADIGAAFPGYGPNHGLDVTLPRRGGPAPGVRVGDQRLPRGQPALRVPVGHRAASTRSAASTAPHREHPHGGGRGWASIRRAACPSRSTCTSTG
jgi:hypothetical protein